MAQHVTTGCFGNSGGYSVVRSHWGAVVSPISGFRGTYMRRMHAFLEESDAESLRRRHRWCAQDIAAQMSRTSLWDTEDRTSDVSTRPQVSRRLVSRVLVGSGLPIGGKGTVCPHCSEVNTIWALMDLALPKFDGLVYRMTQAMDGVD